MPQTKKAARFPERPAFAMGFATSVGWRSDDGLHWRRCGRCGHHVQPMRELSGRGLLGCNVLLALGHTTLIIGICASGRAIRMTLGIITRSHFFGSHAPAQRCTPHKWRVSTLNMVSSSVFHTVNPMRASTPRRQPKPATKKGRLAQPLDGLPETASISYWPNLSFMRAAPASHRTRSVK